MNCFSKNRSGFFIIIGICILFVYVIISDLFPQFMLFDPLNFVREIIISFGLIFPRITVLFFVIANILLPSIVAFIYNTKVTTMQDKRVGSILYFDSENTGGIFGVIISENRISIRIRDLVETFVKNVSYFSAE